MSKGMPDNTVKIALASDHRGFEFKKKVTQILTEEGYKVVDFGTTDGDSSVDYPDYGSLAAKAVSEKECDRAVLICGTGIGMSLTANKIKGIRAVVGNDLYSVEMSRRHNDTNVLCMGADLIPPGPLVKKILNLWLTTPFEGGRHIPRLKKVHAPEES